MLPKEEKILIKNIATRKEVWYEELLTEFPINIGLTTVKRLRWKIDDTGTVNRKDNLTVEENEKLFQQKCNIIAVICC